MWKVLLIFNLMLNQGLIEPTEEIENYSNREMYTLYLQDGGIIEHAYKEEIYKYILTGEFIYEEDYDLYVEISNYKIK